MKCKKNDELSAVHEGGQAGRAGACEWVQDNIALVGAGQDNPLQQVQGFLGGVLAEGLFIRLRGVDGPHHDMWNCFSNVL